MPRSLIRAASAALFGALAGAACFALLYARQPGIVVEMDGDPPALASGFYSSERDGDRTFVWTSGRASLTLAGADRRGDWTCSVTFRGARAAGIPQPTVDVAADGVTLASPRGTNEFQAVDVTVPARPLEPRLRLTLTISPTFVPGDADRRTLGVQVDRIGCRPSGAWWVLPPRRALGRAALAGAMWGAAAGLTGLTIGHALGAAGLVALGQAVALSTGAAPYGEYSAVVLRFASWIALLTAAVSKLIEVWKRQALQRAAGFVVVFSAAVLYLKLLALLHPSKPIVDAVFHAHRLDWVLAGRYYFTQLSTSATAFPYAIGLYVFAAPWAALTRDHVTLLRVVVCGSEMLAGAMLYPLIASTWGDRLVAATAVVLFHLVPLSYVVVGNANLTNAFGQSVSILTVVAATMWTLGMRHWIQWLALTIVATLGLIAHVSTVALLTATLLALACFTRLSGGRELRGRAWSIALATLAAVVLAVALYWGHFGDLYAEQLARLRAGAPQSQKAAPDSRTDDERVPALGRTAIPLSGRVTGALQQTVANIGWPILMFSMVGGWRMWVDRRRDRLVYALAAWAAVWLSFVLFSVLSPIDRRYQQDAWEFIGRVEHATYPAAVILAAYGAAWAWRAGLATRLATSVLLAWAVVIGVREWERWLS